jgi:hypothetical protein
MTDMTYVLPASMVRGCRPWWSLYDGPGPEVADRTAQVLMTFYGEYIDAMVQAEAWCEKHGYYVSEYSDADDREDHAKEADRG